MRSLSEIIAMNKKAVITGYMPKILFMVKQLTEKYGGVTINSNGELIKKEDGYMVGIQQIYLETLINFLNKFNEEMLFNFLEKIKETKYYLGFWFNKEDTKVYIDIVQHISNFHTAIKLAKEFDQLKIYDCANNLEIEVNND